jgi:hypothetical protein
MVMGHMLRVATLLVEYIHMLRVMLRLLVGCFHTSGQYSLASGGASHAEGDSTIASGNFHMLKVLKLKPLILVVMLKVIQLKLMVLLVTLVVLIVKLMVKHRLFMVLIHKQLVLTQ